MLKPTERFSSRVENYRKYRPGYPAEIISLLTSACALSPQSIIADIGSGTGLFTEIFLKNGNRVFGIEPNAEMRRAGEKEMAKYPNFLSLPGTAEATTLGDGGVDFVVAGQAFHWFDRAKARVEFERILKPQGWVILAWNNYRVDKSALMAAYQDIVVKYGTDYSEVEREVVGLDVGSFYAPAICRRATFDFQQTFDYEGLEGRLLSASYAPQPDHPGFESMLGDLKQAFAANSQDGKVIFHYETEVYYGRLSSD